MGEAFERDGVPIVHMLGNGIGQRNCHNWTRLLSLGYRALRFSLCEKFFFQRKE
jgi:hypothetical protein